MIEKKGSEFWEDYYRYWDEFVLGWFRSATNSTDDLSKAIRADASGFSQEDLDVIPEPYQRLTDEVKAIVINMNPGASSRTEFLKRYSQKGNQSRGMLMWEYANACHYSYHEWILKWASLNEGLRGNTPEVPGVFWWQGKDGNGGRMGWIKRLFGDVSPSQVFAMELIPYHSFAFNNDWFKRVLARRSTGDVIRRYAWERVVKPAVIAALENDIPCVACIGKPISESIKELGVLKHVLSIHKDTPLEKIKKLGAASWPVNMKGALTNRTYEILRIEAGSPYWKEITEHVSTNRKHVDFLCTWHDGGNKLPSASFKHIEDGLKKIMCEGGGFSDDNSLENQAMKMVSSSSFELKEFKPKRKWHTKSRQKYHDLLAE